MKGIFLAAVAAMRLAQIASNFDGKAGISAIDLDTGQRVVYKENESFAMASVCKLPIAIAFLQRVDKHEISLADKVTLGPDDFHAGESVIADQAKGQPITLTLEELLVHAVRDSDNSAIDYILAHYVPPKEVMTALRGIRVRNIDISRPEAMIIGQILDEGDTIETRARYAQRMKTMTQPEASHGLGKFWQDTRDNATPNGMADLLEKLYRHQVGLTPASEELLLKSMRETKTGADRIRGGVPADAIVAHKTGTMPGTLNDVGIITSPDGKHHIVMAIFTRWSREVEVDRAKTVAAMAKVAYEELTK